MSLGKSTKKRRKAKRRRDIQPRMTVIQTVERGIVRRKRRQRDTLFRGSTTEGTDPVAVALRNIQKTDVRDMTF